MEGLYRADEINFETNLKVDDVIKITKKYVENKNKPYEIAEEWVLYDTWSEVTNEPVWYIEIIPLEVKEFWPDAYFTLAISDKSGKPVYIMNDHGVVFEKY